MELRSSARLRRQQECEEGSSSGSSNSQKERLTQIVDRFITDVTNLFEDPIYGASSSAQNSTNRVSPCQRIAHLFDPIDNLSTYQERSEVRFQICTRYCDKLHEKFLLHGLLEKIQEVPEDVEPNPKSKGKGKGKGKGKIKKPPKPKPKKKNRSKKEEDEDEYLEQEMLKVNLEKLQIAEKEEQMRAKLHEENLEKYFIITLMLTTVTAWVNDYQRQPEFGTKRAAAISVKFAADRVEELIHSRKNLLMLDFYSLASRIIQEEYINSAIYSYAALLYQNYHRENFEKFELVILLCAKERNFE